MYVCMYVCIHNIKEEAQIQQVKAISLLPKREESMFGGCHSNGALNKGKVGPVAGRVCSYT